MSAPARSFLAFVAFFLAMIAGDRNVSAAMISNCGFETGTFSNWFTLGGGDVLSVRDAGFGSGPAHGMFQALLTNGISDGNFGSAVAPELIEERLLLTVHDAMNGIDGTLDKLILDGTNIGLTGRRAANGTAIYQDITGNAGDRITFDWNFLTNEFEQIFPDQDFAFFSVVNLDPNGPSPLDPALFPDAIDDAVLLAKNAPASELEDKNLPPLIASPNTSFYLETGFQTTTIILQSSGTFRLGFGVIAAKDDRFDSGFLVDMHCEPVPEPASLLLLLAGVLGMIPLVSASSRRATAMSMAGCARPSARRHESLASHKTF